MGRRRVVWLLGVTVGACALALALLSALAGAQGCTDSWTNATGGAWDTASNWSTGKVPTSTDSVCIDVAASQPYTVVVGNETIGVAALTVGAPGAPATLQMGNPGPGTLGFTVDGVVEVQSGGTISWGSYGSFTAQSITNAGTFEVLNAGTASLTTGDVTNTGTFAFEDGTPMSIALDDGSTFDNQGGTITNAANSIVAISTPANGSATVELDSGGTVTNSGTLRVADTVAVDGGTLCGNPVQVGSGDGGTGGTLAFSQTPGTGPACNVGASTDQIQVLNVTGTLSGTIPAAYTVDLGDNGGSFFNVALSGNVVNDGTLVPGFGGDAGTVTAAAASDYLTNDATVTLPVGGAFNAPLVNAGSFSVEGPETASMQNGWSWENTGTGTITIGASDSLVVSSPAGQMGTLQLDAGNTIDNAGTLRATAAVNADGGSICGNPVELGPGDGTTAVSLAFPATFGNAPACGSGSTNDTFAIQNNPATLSGTIPAAYTVSAGDNGGSFFNVALSGDVINQGTFEPGAGGDAGTVSSPAASDYLTNNGTVTVPVGGAFNAPLVNNGSLTVGGAETASLGNGWTWENTGAGTLTVTASGSLALSSPSSQLATLVLEPGSTFDNAGLARVTDTVQAEGGSVCGNPLLLGLGDGTTPVTLEFPATPGSGPACTAGSTNNTFAIQNNPATLSGTIPAGDTVAAGDNGGSFFNVALSGEVINDGTFEPGTGGDAGTVSAANASDALINNGTITIPDGSAAALDVPLVNNGPLTIGGSTGVEFPPTTTLNSGYNWDNTASGTITVGSGETFDIASPSGQSATFTQDGVIGNAGKFNVADPIVINGGTICGDPVNLGLGNTGSSTEPLSLTFASNPTAGPACAATQATDQLNIYNVTASLESNVPAGYTISMGNGGSGFANVTTPVTFTNAGSLEPEGGATLSVGPSGSGTLTNTGTLEVPPVGDESAGTIAGNVDNTTGDVELTDDALLTITGSYTQGSNATFMPAIGGTALEDGYGIMHVEGGSTLAGTLDINTDSGFQPTSGNTFEVLYGSAVSGSFSTVLGEYPPPNTSAYGVSYDASDVTLTVSGQSTTPLTIDQSGDGSGTVTSSPVGIDCGTVCNAGFTQNQNVTLTEAPASGTTFTGWSGGGCSGTQTTCHVTMSTAQTVTASFVTPTATSIGIQSSAEPSITGQQVTYTATVSPVPDGGSVVFYDGGVQVCSSVNVNTTTGKASCSPTYHAIGSHTIQVVYSGDTNYQGSTSGSQIQVVDAAGTATQVTPTANPATVNHQMTYNATVTPVPDGGTVAFTDGGQPISGCGSVTVNTSTGGASCPVTYAAVGSHTVEVSYSGDTNYGGSQSSTLDEPVTTAATSVGLESSSNPSLPGAQVTFTATVEEQAGDVPVNGGTVTFTDGGAGINGCFQVAVNAGNGEATCQVTYTAIADHAIEASYSGDGLDSPAENSLLQSVQPTTTGTTVQSSANPSQSGQQVTFTATVSPIPDGGTVDFTDNSTTITNCGAVAVSTTSGKATCQVTYSSSGSHSIVAVYSGDTHYGTSTSQGLNQVVGTTSTGLQSSANPSVPTEQVTYTATVNPAPDGGTMNFTDNGTTITNCGAVTVSTTTGKATCSATYGSVGSHPIVATYSGDTNFPGSQSSTLNQVVAQTSTGAVVQSSANPSIVGQQVTFTATVTPVPDGGTVSFAQDNSAIQGCGTVAVSTTTGKATCSPTYSAAGSHAIVATYSGDTIFAGATSQSISQSVNKVTTATAVQSSANPSTPGQQVTYTATVTPVPDGGTMGFTDNGSTISGCGAVSVSTSTGNATCSATYSTGGSHPILAVYSGDTKFAGSQNSLAQTVSSKPSAISLSKAAISFPGTKTEYAGAPSTIPYGTTETQTLTITNTGQANLVLGKLALPAASATVAPPPSYERFGGTGATGPLPAYAAFSLTNDQCSGATLAGGASCSVTVTFAPGGNAATLPVSYASTLAVPSSAPTGTQSLNVTGAGIAAPTLSPSITTFGTPSAPLLIGTGSGSSATRVLTIANAAATGSGDLVLGTLTISVFGPPGAWTIGGDQCSGATLPPGASCTAMITLNARPNAFLTNASVVIPNNLYTTTVSPKLPLIAYLTSTPVTAAPAPPGNTVTITTLCVITRPCPPTNITITAPGGFGGGPVGGAQDVSAQVASARKRRTLVVARLTIRLKAHQKRRVRITLDPAGRKLLARKKKLTVTLTVTQGKRVEQVLKIKMRARR